MAGSLNRGYLRSARGLYTTAYWVSSAHPSPVENRAIGGRLFGLLNLALVLALLLPGYLWADTRPKVVEMEGDLSLEFSYFEWLA